MPFGTTLRMASTTVMQSNPSISWSRPDGSIPTYDPAANSLDNIALGRQLLLLYRVTQDAKYYKAATLLRMQLSDQPRNASGGFWHKQIYPDQMWLDGLYMAEPFYAEYASIFEEPQDFADITKQFSMIEEHTRSPKTGLLYHAWDESRKQAWARQDYRNIADLLGTRNGLVHDGAGRHAALLPEGRSRPREAAGHSESYGRGGRPLSGSGNRSLVSGPRQAGREGQLLRIVSRLHVYLCSAERRSARIPAAALFRKCCACMAGNPEPFRPDRREWICNHHRHSEGRRPRRQSLSRRELSILCNCACR